MTASQKFRSVLVAVLACCCYGSKVRSAEFAWQPISASGSATINGTEIILDGGGQRLYFELKLSGWGAATPLATWQATLDPTPLGSVCVGGGNDGKPCFSDGYCFGGGTCVPIRPGPIVAAVEACTVDSDCTAAFGEAWAVCDTVAQLCRPGWQNLGRPDFVAQGWFPAVDISTPAYRYGAQGVGSVFIDDGSIFYGGHLALDVPPNANGIYPLGFLTGFESFMLTSAGEIPVDFTGATIIVNCRNNGDCDDLSECTDDACDTQSGVCSYAPNYNPATHCCAPLTGVTTLLTDGDECTEDVCNPDGTVTHPPAPEFTACGSQGNTGCDNPNSCDGAGNCLDRFEPPGTACGSPIGVDCNDPDTCDGAGTCDSNFWPLGTACGNPTGTQCNNPDTCSAAGVCLQNFEPNGTTCDDGLFCNVNEACLVGTCTGGGPRDCSDGLACTTDTCDEIGDTCVSTLDPGNCLILDTCYAPGAINPGDDCEDCNPTANAVGWTDRSDGSECDDGDSCTGTGNPGIGVDTCTTGVCAGTPDPECNDDCADALVATLGLNEASNHNGGPDSAEASCQPNSNNDVWFVYTADCDGQIDLFTDDSVLLPINDTVLSVYDECPGTGGVEIACDDNGGAGLFGFLSLNTTLGEDYYIRVAGVGNNNGVFGLFIILHDDCRIGTGCYAQGDLDPANDCMECNSLLSTTDWSAVVSGSACGNSSGTDCDAPDTCDGAGTCLPNPFSDGTPCNEEGNPCTQNICEAGICTHPPEPAGFPCLSQDDTDCDNPNTCDGANSCLQNFEPAGFACGDPGVDQCDDADSCDGFGTCLLNHLPDDTDCDDGLIETGFDACQDGECIGIPLAEPPVVEALGSLALLVTPQPPGLAAPVALRLSSPDWPCLDLYVQAGGSLGVSPVEQLVDDWGTIIVPAPEIVPISEYRVVAEIGAFSTAPGSATTGLWADYDASGVVDFRDIATSVKYFTWEVVEPMAKMDIAPCPQDSTANFKDIAASVSAFLDIPYPCTHPCP